MEIVKKTDKYTIIKKRTGRFGVRGPNRQWINGVEKIKILVAEKLLDVHIPKPKAEAPKAGEGEV
ncbi:MAG: hypothetical protein WCG27_01580, partial [Pseudomonadota bacterium]